MSNIGIFDSGVGGLGIFLEIKKILPNESIIYLADNLNYPYGRKTQEQIKKICKKNIEFLIDQGAKIVVIACNSASVLALHYLRSEFPNVPIVGVVPVIKTAMQKTKNKRIGILATTATIKSDYLKGLINEFCPKESGYRINFKEGGELVDMVENLYNLKDEDILKKVRKYINPFIYNNVDVIVLGCTHFPFFKEKINQITNSKILILDSNGAVARQVKRVLTKNNQLESFSHHADYKFFCTKDKGIFKLILRKLTKADHANIYLLKWK